MSNKNNNKMERGWDGRKEERMRDERFKIREIEQIDSMYLFFYYLLENIVQQKGRSKHQPAAALYPEDGMWKLIHTGKRMGEMQGWFAFPLPPLFLFDIEERRLMSLTRGRSEVFWLKSVTWRREQGRER